MGYWAKAPQSRDQLVLFARRLDEAIESDHAVRLLDEILGRLDWTEWEAAYNGSVGQPPLHPRVLAAVLLYGLLKRIRSSRALEEALQVRLDFKWLAEGRTIDHSTLSRFRRRHTIALKSLFIQVALVARDLGLLPLEQLAYDGTRLRANNRRHGSRTPAELKRLRQRLAEVFSELESQIAAADAQEDQTLGDKRAQLPEELKSTRQRLAQVDAALEELKRIEAAGETIPKRLPLTDPESRVTPNKEGGYAPNYTPLATVDVASGMIVATDVIAMTDEAPYLLDQLQQVKTDFELEALPPQVLADGLMSSGDNLIALEEQGVTLYSPAATLDPAKNPALREDLTQPVPEEQWDQLPSKAIKPQGRQLTKEAFVYDSRHDCYWCPAGQRLSPTSTTSELTRSGRRAQRTRYKAQVSACEGCPLRARCLQKRAEHREISRYDHEPHKERLAQRMASPEGQAKYARRRAAGERPFAEIKQRFGGRRFLLRGLELVRMEWRWLATAFNLQQLFRLIRSRAGP